MPLRSSKTDVSVYGMECEYRRYEIGSLELGRKCTIHDTTARIDNKNKGFI